MRKKSLAVFACAMFLAVAGCGQEMQENSGGQGVASPVEGDEVTPEVTSTEKPTPEVTSTEEPTPEVTLTEKPTPEPTATPTPEPTATPTPEPTEAPKEEEGIVLNGLNILTECPHEAYKSRMDVLYGSYKHETYHSETTGFDRGFNILLPADYSEEKKYPVVYLLHGIFGDEYSMADDSNHVKEITANLVKDGKAKDMIVVLPNMYAAWDENQKPSFSQESVLPYDNFINDLVNDLMPYIESHYSVLTGRENTAIAGFSMGGRETLFIGLTRPDLFGYVGAIAPAPGVTPAKDWAMEHPGQMAEADMHFAEGAELPHWLIICCGTKDGVVGKFPESYHNILTNNGVEHIWYEVPGADHDANAIRAGWFNIASHVFQDAE